MSLRRAGAPRLIDWTGERCVPWAPDVQVVYEHYHRYLWARELASDRRVVDLGSGEGFGAALLAEAARSVVGIDVDPRTVDHARLNYGGDTLSFEVASATDLGLLEDDAADMVVAFELIEHVADQETVLREIRRVLSPGGLLVISTPDRVAYAEMSDTPNPFHERELTAPELRELVAHHFEHLRMFSQRTMTGSRIEGIEREAEPGRHLGLTIERVGDTWEEAAGPSPLYLLAVASDGAVPELADDSTLSDFGIALRREAEREVAEARGELAQARAELAEAEAEIRRRAAAAARLADERRELIAEVSVHSRDAEQRLQELEHARQRLAAVDQSIAWKLLQKVRGKVYGVLGGRTSILGRAVSLGIRLVGRTEGRAAKRREWRSLGLPRFPTVDVSIVMPVHSGADLTERCLRSIVATGGTVAYEVIVVDDDADPDTKALLKAVEGLRVLVNRENRGFLHSTNRGAEEARGRHIVLLNNDTEPQPGWLDALVDRAESNPDVGIVVAKLVYPDGTLQEAGGIVWRDGTPWNFGNGGQADAHEYNYARQIDYGSAAAMLVRRELWRKAEGFDPRYAPGYFEDTDLCFTARALGWRVMYDPRAVVVHHEGGSMGTDVTAGGKRHQVLNQPKFAEKWSEALRDQPAQPSVDRAYMASDHRRGPQVLIVDHRLPTPDRDSGSLRMWGMIEALIELGCRVAFLPDNGQRIEPYATRLRAMGVEVLDGALVVPEVIAALGNRLSLTILSRPYVAARYIHLIREFAPGSKLAYDTVDLHFLRERRRMEQGQGGERVADTFLELELALARASDVTLVVSDDERGHLLEVAPDLAVDVVPNANEVEDDVPGPEERSGLLFVGGFEHLPNTDAVTYLAREIMPLVWRSVPDAHLTVVGSNAPPEIEQLAGPRIDVAGWVEDLGPLLRESLVMVAPLRYGAGMKGKVTQSLAAGLPVVTTSSGAEGLDAEDGRELLFADDAEAIAERIVQLHGDAMAWRELSAAGRALAERVCSPRVQVEAMRRLLEVDASQRLLAPAGAR
jgi:GT2 family glycosyltransferase/SAM-dependent methyltransferase/glycosyltransferase involved in cell wall biosynthesis